MTRRGSEFDRLKKSVEQKVFLPFSPGSKEARVVWAIRGMKAQDGVEALMSVLVNLIGTAPEKTRARLVAWAIEEFEDLRDRETDA